MKEAIERCKRALSRKDLVGIFSHYLLRDRTLTAGDGRMTVSTPTIYDGTFLAPGVDLERLVARLKDPITLTIDSNSITLKSERMRGTIQTIDPTTYNLDIPTYDSWLEPPSSLINALKIVRPFISDNAIHSWALAACLNDDHIIATTNVSIIKVFCPALCGAGQLLPNWAIDYVLSRKDSELVGFQLHENFAAFLWDDDSWMRAQLINDKFPDAVPKLFQDFKEPTWELTDEWREAYQSVSELADGHIEIHETKLVGQQEKTTTEHTIPFTPLPPDTEFTKWQPVFLDAVAGVAAYWQPDRYPDPAPFAGLGIQGFIMGRR